MKNSKADMAALEEGLRIDFYEIKSGEMAQEKGTDPSVVKLGETLARDHSSAAANDEKVAKKVGAPVPKGPSPKMMALLKKLGGLKGAAFDKAFLAAEVKGHLEAIKKAKAEIAKGTSPLIVKATKANLKMYEDHLRMARAAQQEGSSAGGE
jgi:putative membrane protein